MSYHDAHDAEEGMRLWLWLGLYTNQVNDCEMAAMGRAALVHCPVLLAEIERLRDVIAKSLEPRSAPVAESAMGLTNDVDDEPANDPATDSEVSQ